LGRGGKGKSKKSIDWYEIKLMGQLPLDDNIHIPDTGMSKQDIYNFFDKQLGLSEKSTSIDDLVDDADASRKVSKKMVDQILERGKKNFRIKFRPPFKDEKARFGYYYKTSKGAMWIKNIRDFRRKQKEL